MDANGPKRLLWAYGVEAIVPQSRLHRVVGWSADWTVACVCWMNGNSDSGGGPRLSTSSSCWHIDRTGCDGCCRDLSIEPVQFVDHAIRWRLPNHIPSAAPEPIAPKFLHTTFPSKYFVLAEFHPPRLSFGGVMPPTPSFASLQYGLPYTIWQAIMKLKSKLKITNRLLMKLSL